MIKVISDKRFQQKIKDYGDRLVYQDVTIKTGWFFKKHKIEVISTLKNGLFTRVQYMKSSDVAQLLNKFL